MSIDTKSLDSVALGIRSLSIDAIEKSKSGHPGMVLGLAEFGSLFFGEIYNQNPKYLNWQNRDRFVLSAGHGSMLLYSLLHLSGYNYSIDDIKNFRQLGSNTPGHPEVELEGVDATTGPLGQGFSYAVGMALASKMQGSIFNTDDYKIVDNKVFAISGDGDLMEGITYEAASMAGHMELDNLFVFFDSNRITIEGPTSIAFSEDVEKRFESQGWHVGKASGYDYKGILDVYNEAKKVKNKPHLIILDTVIGKSSLAKEDSKSSHGAPLGQEDAKATKNIIGVPEGEHFYVPKEAYSYFKEKQITWDNNYAKWEADFESWATKYPELKEKWDEYFSNDNIVIENSFDFVNDFSKEFATRVGIKNGLTSVKNILPNLIGGSADLGSSCGSVIVGETVIQGPTYHGRHIQFGIREHAMGGVMNGIALYGGFKVFGGTFFSFSNYMLPSIRMAALMQLPVNFYFSHDSVYVGEDGPTHQPIELIHQLRYIPNLNVMRPADINETYVCQGIGFNSKTTPTVIISSRQALPVIDRKKLGCESYFNAKNGAYTILKEKENKKLDGIIIATGSEVAKSIDAAIELRKKGKNVKVVNFISTSIFDKQTNEYKNSVLPNNCRKRLAIEASYPDFWRKYVGIDGDVIGVDKFGVSAPAIEMEKMYGFNKTEIINRYLKLK